MGYDLVVIGAGPGGYVAAIRGAQLGLSVACIEKASTLGGTCLNVGCIPSKALLESSERLAQIQHDVAAHGIRVGSVELDLTTMLARKSKIVSQLTQGIAGLLKKNKITRLSGHARILTPDRVEVVDATGTSQVIEARNILIATGSEPAPLAGVICDGDRIGTSTEALSYAEVPRHLAVIGAGVIGLELGSVWARLGAKVTVLEFGSGLLPGFEPEIAKLALKLFTRQGLGFEFGARVTAGSVAGPSVTLSYTAANGEQRTIGADRVLVCVGRRPYTQGLGLPAVGVELDARGFVKVDAHYQTVVPGIWAIGDVIGPPMLAHKAEEEGIAAVEALVGTAGHVCYDAIPNVIYTQPELAMVGSTSAQLDAAGVRHRSGSFPFAANGRAQALGETDGMIKIIADATTDRILGVHCIGPRVSELCAEAAIAIEFCASAEDLARSVHAHPTLAEVMKEAALAVSGRTLHL